MSRNLVFTLSWTGFNVDLDLAVREPSGEWISYLNLVSETGGYLIKDLLVNGANYVAGVTYTESVQWPLDQSPDDPIYFRVTLYGYNISTSPSVPYTLNAYLDGALVQQETGYVTGVGDQNTYLFGAQVLSAAVGRIEMGGGQSALVTELPLAPELSMIYKPAVSLNNLGTAVGAYPLTVTNYTTTGDLTRREATNTTGFSTGIPSSVLWGTGTDVNTVILYEYGDTSFLNGYAATATPNSNNPDGRAQAYMELYTDRIHNTLQRSDYLLTPLDVVIRGSMTEFRDEVDRSFTSGSSALRPNARFWAVSSGNRVKYYVNNGATFVTETYGSIFFDANGFYFRLSGAGSGDQAWLNGARGMGVWRSRRPYSTADFTRLAAEYDAAG